jgi:ATP-binding protein involved in chromosome partitioning
MFQKMGTPILGVVENMAWFEGPDAQRIAIFGAGGAATEAERLGVPLLAQVPIEIGLREACDTGRPLVASAPQSAAAQAFLAMAAKLS